MFDCHFRLCTILEEFDRMTAYDGHKNDEGGIMLATHSQTDRWTKKSSIKCSRQKVNGLRNILKAEIRAIGKRVKGKICFMMKRVTSFLFLRLFGILWIVLGVILASIVNHGAKTYSRCSFSSRFLSLPNAISLRCSLWRRLIHGHLQRSNNCKHNLCK